MSEHVWTQENIGAYLAGGLEPAEGERLEKHAAECAGCAGAIEQARSLGRLLAPLFIDARPGPALEDQIIQSLPAEPPPRRTWRRFSGNGKIILAVAAAVFLAVIGAGVNFLMEEEHLRFPAATPSDATGGYRLGVELVGGTVQIKGKKSLWSTEYATVDLGTGSMAQYAEGKGRGRADPEDNAEKSERILKSADDLAKDLRLENLDLLTKEKNKVALSYDGRGNDPKSAAQTYPIIPAPGSSAGSPDPSATPPPGETPPAGKEEGRKFRFPSFPKAAPIPPARKPGMGNGSFGLGGGMPGGGGMMGGGGWGMPPGTMPGGGMPAGNMPYYNKIGGEGKADSKSVELLWKYIDKVELPALKADYFKPAGDLARLETEMDKAQKESKEGGKLADQQSKNEPRKPATPGRDVADADQNGQKAEPNQPPPPTPRKIIIRSGELEFEIDSFDTTVSTIMRLVTASKGGFVATINSDKLANGKVRGSVVVRLPPDQLDKFILDLRKELAKTGELKNQHIGSQDITKQYTDLESRLRAARTMEERLLNIIKDGKGQIKDLLQAEKELGVWRTKIEEMEGELRYYSNLVSLSTLTIKLSEKEIRTAALVTENERVQSGIEVEDVEKAYQEALKAIAEVKGRVSKSELKQHAAGQFNAILHFEVSPESTGPTRDRLKQLGNMVRLQIDRVQQTENGGQVLRDAKVKRGDTQFLVSIYNLANVAPRETVILRLAAADVPAVYQKLRSLIAKAKGHVINAQLNEQDRQNINAQLAFDVSRLGEGEIQAALVGAGETLSRQVNRVPENDNVTDSKVLYRVSLVDADAIQPRETVVVKIAALDVPDAYQKLRVALDKVKARVINAQLNEQDRRNITAQLDFAFKRSDEAALQAALTAAGESLSRQVTRLPESPTVTDAKVLARVELIHTDSLPPRETVTTKIATTDVPGSYQKLRDAVAKAKGRTASAQLNEQDRRNVTAQVRFEVPRGEDAALQAVLAEAGEALMRQVARQQDTTSVTDTRVGFQVDLLPAASIPPRETTTLALEVQDVGSSLSVFNAQVKESQGRNVETNVGQERNGQVSARVVFDVPFSEAAALVEKFKTGGQVRVHQVTRDPQAPEGKLALARIIVTVSNAELLVPSDKGFWSQARHGLAFSLRGLSISASWLIVGLLFVLPWALLVYVVVWSARRMWRGPVAAAATTAGNVPTPPAV